MFDPERHPCISPALYLLGSATWLVGILEWVGPVVQALGPLMIGTAALLTAYTNHCRYLDAKKQEAPKV